MITNNGDLSTQRRTSWSGRRTLAGVGAGVALLAAATVSAGAPAAAAPNRSWACASTTSAFAARAAHFGGLVRPLGGPVQHCGFVTPKTSGPYGGSPPLTNHGGAVMGTSTSTDNVQVTPIYWAPSGFSFTASYTNVLSTYLTNLAADSGKLTNVFASTWQYAGNNGGISNHLSMGSAITDTTAFPTAGCTTDAGAIYSDATGYTTCLDDDQIQAEIASVISAHSLPTDLGHLYVIYLPKGVESCFYPTGTVGQACSINSTPSAAFCAYHSYFGPTSNVIYANMPFPVYGSATGLSCTTEHLNGATNLIQSPNGDTNADVEVSPLSHEMSEAITDPRLDAWYDSGGNENGDDCAYIYGAVAGLDGGFYNQTVNGAHYLTQQEFSNKDYVFLTSGCISAIQAVTPAVTSMTSSGGPPAGGQTITITGTDFPGTTGVSFGPNASPDFTVLDATHIAAVVPAGVAGKIDVTVTNAAGTSPAAAADKYTYFAKPAITAVSPKAGPVTSGHAVTITGTGLTGAMSVVFGSTHATSVVVVSPTKITAKAPAHSAGVVNVRVTTPGGTSAAVNANRYTYLSRPTVTGLSSSSGTKAGGKTVTISGTHFVPGTTVRFGKAGAASVTFVSGTKIKVHTPKHAAGRVDVFVTTPGGTSAAKSVDHYTFT